eukprot:356499-Chlamydomonas_euryale.AAC.2
MANAGVHMQTAQKLTAACSANMPQSTVNRGSQHSLHVDSRPHRMAASSKQPSRAMASSSDRQLCIPAVLPSPGLQLPISCWLAEICSCLLSVCARRLTSFQPAPSPPGLTARTPRHAPWLRFAGGPRLGPAQRA